MDVFTKKKRSEIMANIRAKDTEPEKAFFKLLSSEFYPKDFRYRKHYGKLPGKPDVVFVAQKLAIFIDGEFWHGYRFNKQKSRLPKRYWINKIERNIQRDREINRKLRKTGWAVLRFWGHNIKKNPGKIIGRINQLLK